MAGFDDYGDLFAIDVGADDYAEAATSEAANVARTFQSEVAFQKIKAGYTAKIDIGNNYEELLRVVPVLQQNQVSETKTKLSNKDKNLLGYAVGEMYYDQKFSEVVDLCQRVQAMCAIDARLEENLKRWMSRCEAKQQNVDAV